MAVRTEAQKAAQRERSRRYREKHPERAKASDKASKARNAEQRRAYARVRNRKLAGCVAATAETREGPCEICARHLPLVWDHDHSDGAFRGWICDDCNVALGRFEDSTERMQKAIAYLNRQR